MKSSRRILIDPIAKDIARNHFGLPDCLHVPVAARDEKAIEDNIGAIIRPLGRGPPANAYLIEAYTSATIDTRLPIWDNPTSAILHQTNQVWVAVKYTRYRAAYKKAFPRDNIDGLVLSHSLNRRVAALKGFLYVRVTPTSRGANSSSAFSEQMSLDHHSEDRRKNRNKQSQAAIQYADLMDLMLMMDIKLGGGVQNIANESQALIKPV